MKHIIKNNEPPTLRAHRETPGSTYDGPQEDWQEQLLIEQGGLCAYCMGRISIDRTGGRPHMEIEHYYPRQTYPAKRLLWRNMLGVCNGKLGNAPHCDKTDMVNRIRGKLHGDVNLAILNPLTFDDSEGRLTYSFSGEIKSNSNNPDVEEDLCRLNLNDPKLKGFRKDAIDRARQLLEKKYPDKKWNQNVFLQEIEIWESRNSDHLFQPYCQAAMWYLNWMAQRSKYQ